MPKPLFTKLVAVAAIGFLCLLGGGVYGLSSGDRMLFTLSVLIDYYGAAEPSVQ